MKRELNPNIFGQQTPAPELGRSISRFDESEASAPSLPHEARHELKTLRADLVDLEKETALEIHQAVQHSEALANHFTQLFESLSTRIAHIEAQMGEHQNAQSEQNDVNQKIEDLLERHNQIVRNFENKMIHLSRILSEQEVQLLGSQSALEEAHREISKLRS